VGGHTDYNWAFTAPGSYTVAFEASGTLTGVGVVGSGPVSYRFQVVPEPATIALFASGAAMLGLASRRQKLRRRPVQSPSR
jgi:surface-anchored protein